MPLPHETPKSQRVFTSFALDIPSHGFVRARVLAEPAIIAHVARHFTLHPSRRMVICPACLAGALSLILRKSTPYGPDCTCHSCGELYSEANVEIQVRRSGQMPLHLSYNTEGRVPARFQEKGESR